MRKRFELAPYDLWSWISTILGSLALTVVSALKFLASEQWAASCLSDLLLLFFWLLWLTTLFLSPWGYLLTDTKIVIQRGIFTIALRYEQIEEVRFVDRVEFSLFRLFGSAGLFGYFGLLIPEDGSRARVYASRWNKMVQLKTAKGIYYLSPADPLEMVTAIQERLAGRKNS
ncbi:MAG: PH domain-containing protein [Thermoanaerobacteraceae bacterium]|nr:PH domain-containing protein [Thermoanaerobacteraceae bacterium]